MSKPVLSVVPAPAAQTDRRAAPGSPTLLSVVVPTFNEHSNVAALVHAVSAALHDVAWEIILVDDNSPDGTWSEAKDLAQRNARVRCIRRIGRRGLAGACIEGILSSSAPLVAVMDADFQHDEQALRLMFGMLRRGEADIAIGTRLDITDPTAFSFLRQAVSNFGRKLSRAVLKHDVCDPMSGFFMIGRHHVETIAPQLSIDGFKILADILMTAPPSLRVVEIPYAFRPRRTGASKFGMVVSLDYLGLLAHKLSGGKLPVRFVLFACVGASGVAVHLAVLRLILAARPELGFFASQMVATYVAMASNFLMNNHITFRDSRFRSRRAAVAFAIFCGFCSVGSLANADLASRLFRWTETWWLAGVAGALVSSVWNYATSRAFVWSRR